MHPRRGQRAVHRQRAHGHPCPRRQAPLAQAAGLTLGLEQAQDIVLTDRADNVADDAAVLVLALADNLDTDLGDTTTGASAAEALGDTSVFNFLLHGPPGRQVRWMAAELCTICDWEEKMSRPTRVPEAWI